MLPKLHLDEDYPCSLVGNWNTWYGEQDQAGEVPLSPVPLLPPNPGLQQLSYLSALLSLCSISEGMGKCVSVISHCPPQTPAGYLVFSGAPKGLRILPCQVHSRTSPHPLLTVVPCVRRLSSPARTTLPRTVQLWFFLPCLFYLVRFTCFCFCLLFVCLFETGLTV